MNLVNVPQARSIWLFDTTELNPLGLDLLPVVQAINARYKFQKFPKPEEIRMPSSGGAWEFEGGTFQTEDSQWIVVNGSVYNDGLVATTQANTALTDAFLLDLLTFISRQFRLRFEPSMLREKRYLSQLVVSSERLLLPADDKAAAFSLYLSGIFNLQVPIEPIGIHFGPDPAAVGGKSFALRLERKVSTPFSQNTYFSEAPLSTQQHFEVLKKFEEIMG
jgi:hypothetical protein